jgi:hypothetical protein
VAQRPQETTLVRLDDEERELLRYFRGCNKTYKHYICLLSAVAASRSRRKLPLNVVPIRKE